MRAALEFGRGMNAELCLASSASSNAVEGRAPSSRRPYPVGRLRWLYRLPSVVVSLASIDAPCARAVTTASSSASTRKKYSHCGCTPGESSRPPSFRPRPARQGRGRAPAPSGSPNDQPKTVLPTRLRAPPGTCAARGRRQPPSKVRAGAERDQSTSRPDREARARHRPAGQGVGLRKSQVCRVDDSEPVRPSAAGQRLLAERDPGVAMVPQHGVVEEGVAAQRSD